MSKHLSLLMHFVWSTKNRLPMITHEIRPRLHAYIGGILSNKKAVGLCINGTNDHIHVYASLPSTLDIAEAVSAMKSNSSRWVHETFPRSADFMWQNGYGAFSVSYSEDERVRKYILNQEEHHRVVSYQDEYRAFLKRHHMEIDERYDWE